MKWIKGRDGLPSLFKKVQWRNADGGNIPLGEATPLEHYKKTGANIEWHEWLDSSHPEQGEQGEDPFIQKHLAIIMDKMLDGMIITHIEKMFGSLEMASVEHFIETGKVNGSLYLNIKELAKKFAAGWHNQAAKLSSPPPEGQNEYEKGYADGWRDATKEAAQEIREHYKPNNE